MAGDNIIEALMFEATKPAKANRIVPVSTEIARHRRIRDEVLAAVNR